MTVFYTKYHRPMCDEKWYNKVHTLYESGHPSIEELSCLLVTLNSLLHPPNSWALVLICVYTYQYCGKRTNSLKSKQSIFEFHEWSNIYSKSECMAWLNKKNLLLIKHDVSKLKEYQFMKTWIQSYGSCGVYNVPKGNLLGYTH